MFDSDMLFRIPALLIALTIHEYSHARMAVMLGDPTPRFMGRLTLNPIPHLDPIGLIMLWLAQFGWAKPVEVNPRNFSDPRQGMLYVSLAGPMSNVVLAFVTAVVIAILSIFGLLDDFWRKMLTMLYLYNLYLAVFNMLPIPPLDGSKVLASLVPSYENNRIYSFLEQYGFMVLMALVILGVVRQIIYPFVIGLDNIIRGFVKMVFIFF
jgi:Zn-dependent protease